VTIFFVWSGKQGDVYSSGIGGVGDYSAVGYGGQDFGVVDGLTNTRATLSDRHDDLTVLPGVNGKLNEEQALALRPAFPHARAGDAMVDILSTIYAATSAEIANPNNY
jgi:hypothetical protein